MGSTCICSLTTFPPLAGDRVDNNSVFLNIYLGLSFKIHSHLEIVLILDFVHEILEVCVNQIKQKSQTKQKKIPSTNL